MPAGSSEVRRAFYWAGFSASSAFHTAAASYGSLIGHSRVYLLFPVSLHLALVGHGQKRHLGPLVHPNGEPTTVFGLTSEFG